MSTQDDDDGDGDQQPLKPTREELREEAVAYGELADKLAKGKSAELPDPPFDSELRKAVLDARTLVKNARNRQIRRLARLLREAAPLEEIRAALEGRTPAMRAKQAQERSNEAWRKRLLEEGDRALTEFVTQHPAADPTRLRQLVRQANKTPPDPRAKKAATTLIREVRALRGATDSDETPPNPD